MFWLTRKAMSFASYGDGSTDHSAVVGCNGALKGTVSFAPDLVRNPPQERLVFVMRHGAFFRLGAAPHAEFLGCTRGLAVVLVGNRHGAIVSVVERQSEYPSVVHLAMTATLTRPPSTSMTVPWTKVASSLAR